VIAVLAIVFAVVVTLEPWGGGSSSLRGSGVPASQVRALPPFRSVELAGSNIVTIHVGGRQSVVVHADRNLLDHVTTEVRAGRLVINNKPGSYASKSPMSVDVAVPSLTALRLSGSGIISADGVNASSMTITLPGSGDVNASGKAARLDVAVGGSGNARLASLPARDARAVIGGSGTIVVNATNSLRAAIPGSGVIFYLGNPEHVTTSISGSGTILQGAE
jgi:hypothetical protein